MDLQNNAVSSAPKAKKSSVLFGFSKMFKFSFKQNLICLLLSVVVFACVFPVRAVIMMQDANYIGYSYSSFVSDMTVKISREERLKEIFSNIFNPNGGAVFALTLIIALFFSIVMFSYLHNKKAINFYHSLPVKREAHLLSSVAVSAAYYLISLFSCIFVTVLIMLGSGIGGALIPTAIRCFLFNFSYFIFISAFFALFAVICGNSGAHFIFSVLGLIFVPAVHSLTIEFLTIGQTNLDTSNLYTDRMFGFESPAAFYFKISKNMISAGTGRFLLFVFGFILAAAAILFITILIYRKIGSEDSGRPIFFRRLGTVLKYVLAYAVMLGTGMLAYELTYSKLGNFIGFVIGALIFGFLAFAVINVIFECNKKKFFSGMKGFATLFAVFIVVFSFSFFDPFKFNEKIPSASSLESITVKRNGESVFISDREDIEKIVDFAKNSDGGERFSITYEYKSGSRLTKYCSLPSNDEIFGILSGKNTLKSTWAYVKDNKENIDSMSISYIKPFFARDDRLLECIDMDIEKAAASSTGKALYNVCIRILTDNGNYCNMSFAVTEDMENTLAHLKQKFGTSSSFKELSKSVDYICITVNNDYENGHIINDKEQIEEILLNSYDQSMGIFETAEHLYDYEVAVYFDDDYSEVWIRYFTKDTVPDFVLDLK